MRVLFLSQLLPLPLDAGPKIRAYYVLRYLAEAGHEVTLLSFLRPSDTEQEICQLRRFCASVETVPLARSRTRDLRYGIQSCFSSTPFLVLRDQQPLMERRLEEIAELRSWDAFHVDQLWMAPYVVKSNRPALTVLDQHNAVFTIPRQMAKHSKNPLVRTLLRNESCKLEMYERRTCDDFDNVVWVSDEDRKALRTSQGASRSRDMVIPIATDPSARLRVKRTQPFRITFLGGMHWPPNSDGVTWFAEKVWPTVARTIPSAVFTVIGKAPPAKLRSSVLGSRIETTGYVSQLQGYLAETSVFVVPLHSGAGMRVKVLDAWCWGLPVVSTSVGAEGLRAVHRENLLIADAPESFAASVISVFQSSQIANRLSDGGRATVEAVYDWRSSYKTWDRLYH
ncbi:MAG: glycosyltransferase family 4 protein [Acidobacteriota bacterium]